MFIIALWISMNIMHHEMNIHNWIRDIHNWVMDNHDSLVDVNIQSWMPIIKFSMMIPLDGLINTCSGQNCKFVFLAFFFQLVFVVTSKIKLIPFFAVTSNGWKFDMLIYPDHLGNWLDFDHRLLIFLILVAFWLSETGQICDFRAFS